jgi:uncharacterized membrane protein YciS (DUF1049 family)
MLAFIAFIFGFMAAAIFLVSEPKKKMLRRKITRQDFVSELQLVLKRRSQASTMIKDANAHYDHLQKIMSSIEKSYLDMQTKINHKKFSNVMSGVFDGYVDFYKNIHKKRFISSIQDQLLAEARPRFMTRQKKQEMKHDIMVFGGDKTRHRSLLAITLHVDLTNFMKISEEKNKIRCLKRSVLVDFQSRLAHNMMIKEYVKNADKHETLMKEIENFRFKVAKIKKNDFSFLLGYYVFFMYMIYFGVIFGSAMIITYHLLSGLSWISDKLKKKNDKKQIKKDKTKKIKIYFRNILKKNYHGKKLKKMARRQMKFSKF